MKVISNQVVVIGGKNSIFLLNLKLKILKVFNSQRVIFDLIFFLKTNFLVLACENIVLAFNYLTGKLEMEKNNENWINQLIKLDKEKFAYFSFRYELFLVNM